jgi:hypothetical protein
LSRQRRHFLKKIQIGVSSWTLQTNKASGEVCP